MKIRKILNEFVIKQYQEFWNAIASSQDASMQQAAAANDLDALLKLFSGKEEELAKYADSQGWNIIGTQIRRKIGDNYGDWTGPNRPGVWGGDY